MKAKKPLTQPTAEAEKAQREIVNNTKTEVEVRGKRYRIGAVYNDTLDYITDLQLVEEANPKQMSCKCAAALWLNNYFLLRLLHWLVWRWWYYVKQYTEEELTPLIVESKKKVEKTSMSYYTNTILLTDCKNTTMAMTMEEAKRIQAELLGAQAGRVRVQGKAGASSPT